jgi:hypothetical protein
MVGSECGRELSFSEGVGAGQWQRAGALFLRPKKDARAAAETHEMEDMDAILDAAIFSLAAAILGGAILL